MSGNEHISSISVGAHCHCTRKVLAVSWTEINILSFDLLSIGLSIPVGGGIGAYVASRILSKKFGEQMKQASAENERLVETLRFNRQQELREKERLYTDEIGEAQRNIARLSTELSLRESELQILSSSEAQFLQTDSSARMYQLLVHNLERSFNTNLVGCLLFAATDNWDLLASDAHGTLVDPTEILTVGSLDKTVFEQNSSIVLQMQELPALQTKYPSAQCVTILPLQCRDRKLGLACILWSTSDYQREYRLARKLLEAWTRSMYRIQKHEEEVVAGRIDRLTGLPNSKYFDEYAPAVLRSTSDERPLSFLLVECDNLKEINDRYGHVIGDQMIKQLSELMMKSARIEELSSKKRQPDQFFRHTGLQFLVILEETNSIEACTVAERIRCAAESKTDWVGGVPKWSVSIGAVTSPQDGTDAVSLRIKAEVALMYVRERLNGNQSIHFDVVPRTYRVSKLSARVGGSLDVFDPCTVLQSMASAGKTGILTVAAADGRKFWAFIDQNKVTKAYLGPFRGDAAIVEFVSTFEEGEFNFQEYNALGSSGIEDLHHMDGAYSVNRPIERLLMDGISAQETLSTAKRLIPDTKLFVRPTANANELLSQLRAEIDYLSPAEVETILAILKQVNGRTMWSAIVDRMDSVPTYMRWHAASILVKHKVVELSRIGMNYSV